MSSIEEIANELLAIDSSIDYIESVFQRETSEINNTINKAQSTFSDQLPGQGIVNTMYKTIQNIIAADSSMHSLRLELRDYIQNIKK